MSARRRGKGKGVYAIPVGCALIALATVLWTSGRSGTEAAEREGTVREVPSGISQDVADALRTSSVEPSSRKTFLSDLEGSGQNPDGGGDPVCVLAWTEPCDLPATAEEALCAYRQRGAVTLMASGYLDLAGNVWAALLRHDDGAVDIMTVSTADGSSSEVRVARLRPEGL